MSTSKSATFAVPLAIASLIITGCASTQGSTISGSAPTDLLAEKDKEIDRLSAEIAMLETREVPGSEHLAGADSQLLPPDAKPGQCFARAFIPAKYEIGAVRVLKSEESSLIEAQPPEYEWVEERILVTEVSEKLEVVPAVYETVAERILVKPDSTKYVSVPAQYKTEVTRVVEKPEHTVWKKGTGPITKVDEATGEIMCLVTVPATYKSVSKRVLISPASTNEVTIPAEYKTVQKRVMRTPPSTRKIIIPAEYDTIMVRKLVKPASTQATVIPAEYESVQQRKLFAASRVEWRPVLCETNVTAETVRRIQTALDGSGFNPGRVDGVLGADTMSAVKRYQQSKGLATGGLTIQTLESLKVSI